MTTSTGPVATPHTVPRAVGAFQRFADALALAATYLAATCLFALTLLVLAEVALGILNRLFKGLPKDIPIAWEYSAYLMGAAFMLAVDTLCRTLAATEIPPGVATAFVGTPVFIALLAATFRR